MKNKFKLYLIISVIIVLLGIISFSYIYILHNPSTISNSQYENILQNNQISSENTQTVDNSTLNSNSTVTKIVYGQSTLGRNLEAFLIKGNGANSKTIFLNFEVHGFEDEYSKDGQVLVDLGNTLAQYYTNHPDSLGDYQMIIVPSANPDGLIDGTNNYRASVSGAFGRCTATGVDINRDFKEGSFKAVESQFLRDLMNEYPMNIHIDFHGWEDSVIGDPSIVKIFRSELNLTTDKSNQYGTGQGYLIAYTKENYGAHSAIVEFKNSKSVDATSVEVALNLLMKEI